MGRTGELEIAERRAVGKPVKTQKLVQVRANLSLLPTQSPFPSDRRDEKSWQKSNQDIFEMISGEPKADIEPSWSRPPANLFLQS